MDLVSFLFSDSQQHIQDLTKLPSKYTIKFTGGNQTLADENDVVGIGSGKCNLGLLYANGSDVEKDMDKAFRHYEAAAMKGHVFARHNLGCEEFETGNYDLALQHWMIAAKLGDEHSLTNVKRLFMAGLATKADYAGALRGYKKALGGNDEP
ncbi:hypothetical protein THAOC_26814 [Thalassiosira oceanica]|uniref:Uncharacterized protein n=1 Tax=Thalassiosira oceanica TaxID=159749 RepID=K0RNA9_THAOC|nr:hypothetical protein THAOC_26814 [Thalassiosira oceanica]|eukprot:EJK53694.1 hypothetical protein THAOC_26814 [Thalassiosira oceanica]